MSRVRLGLLIAAVLGVAPIARAQSVAEGDAAYDAGRLHDARAAVYRLRCEVEGTVHGADVERCLDGPREIATEVELEVREGQPIPTKGELERALRENGGSIRATAKQFGRDRRQIYRWIEAYGLAR
jgi:hypothetical protein